METEIAGLTKAIEELEIRTLLSGEYDSREALVTIRSGAGGVDAADFAEMLLRMYLRWAERHGYPTEVYETSYAEEAGLKSATFAVKVPYAYGTLASSRARTGWSGSARSTTRAAGRPGSPAVEVVPVVEQTDDIDIPEDEMRVDVYRSSGPGWSEREHHRLGGAAHPPPDRHRGHLPEREVPDAEPGVRDGRAPGPAAGAQAARRSRPRWTA